MTPSGWHSDARFRDAGHDEMQLREFRNLSKKVGELKITRRKRYANRDSEYILHSVAAEFAFVTGPQHAKNQVIGFADLGVRFVEVQTERDKEEKKRRGVIWQPESWFWFIEFKPSIDSVGAVIRQCEALRYTAIRAGYGNFEAFPAVYRDDPKAEMLVEMYSSTALIDRPK